MKEVKRSSLWTGGDQNKAQQTGNVCFHKPIETMDECLVLKTDNGYNHTR